MEKNFKTRIAIVIFTAINIFWLATPSIAPASELEQAGLVSRADLILAMNTLRVSYGLPALIEDPIINSVAQSTAETMAANNMSWHIGDVRGRLAAAGYGGGATVWATENFAVGNMSIDEIMQVWSDPDHMRPAVNPAYCHVGAGVAQAANGRYYYILQAAYTSEYACGEYTSVAGDDPDAGSGGVPQYITPVQIATPDAEGRIYHIVQAGQTFWSIAIAYQVTIHDLEVWNNLSRENDLYIGQKLFIPSSGTEGYATPTPLGMVTLATPDAEGKIIHEVQPYQALIPIAEAYNVALDTILALNNWHVDWPLQIGQKLLIGIGKGTPSPPLSAIEKLTPASDGNYYHEVKSGESLTSIATLYEINIMDLMAWNGLSSDAIIRPGQKLVLRITPPPTRTPTPVQPGSTSAALWITATPIESHEVKFTPTTPANSTAIPTQTNATGMTSLLVVFVLLAGLLIAIFWVRKR